MHTGTIVYCLVFNTYVVLCCICNLVSKTLGTSQKYFSEVPFYAHTPKAVFLSASNYVVALLHLYIVVVLVVLVLVVLVVS